MLLTMNQKIDYMKKKRLILLALTVLTLGLYSCAEDFPQREASYDPGDDSMGVFFPSTNPINVEVEPTDSYYLVTISRINSANAAIVKLIELTDTSNMFTVPTSIAFRAGQSDTTVRLSFGDLVDFVPYQVRFAIDESFTNPYDSAVAGTAEFILNVTQSDYIDFAEGTFDSEFFEDSWPQKLQYSETLDAYRFPNLYSLNYHFLFNWAGVNSAVIIPQGDPIEDKDGWFSILTGYVDPTYGMISAWINSDVDKTNYSSESQIIKLNVEFMDDFGTWGIYDESFTITSFN